ncbi:MAG: hypothetical protein JWN56_2915 [Sphingobacteriales bacterium]|nr:hypothetical protein [Sphingobacteriales bacterium]
MDFNEDFLHYVWKFRLFKLQNLTTQDGESLEITAVGIHNSHAGPDFENSKIKIGETLWVGNVEVHLISSDWIIHKHHTDEAYDNVILHVVYKHTQDIFRTNGTKIPVLVLKNLISAEVISKYSLLMRNLNWIPCEQLISTVDQFHIKNWLSRTLMERLEHKIEQVTALLIEFNGSWDDAFYIMLAKNFGFKTNALPFEMLSRALPPQLIAKNKDQPIKVEALLFGQAGLLSEKQVDNYPKTLLAEYKYLQKKYDIKPINTASWKFMRMRPQNFPTIRLAQFSALILTTNHLFSTILETKNVDNLTKIFEGLSLNSYWDTHFIFDSTSKFSSKNLGKQSIYNILINTIAVFLFAYGKFFKLPNYISDAIVLLETLPSESNEILIRFKKLGLTTDKAFTSQALLQLKGSYCDQKKCLSCGIGIKLLSTNN